MCHLIFEKIMNEIECMIDDVAAEIVVLLMTKRNMSFLEAIDTVYTSDTYSKLCDKDCIIKVLNMFILFLSMNF